MDFLLSQGHNIFRYLVECGILILEFFGTSVLIVTGVKSMIKWLKKEPDARSDIAQGILLALAFKMGGEVLRTVIIEEPRELFSIFAIILLRGLVAVLIYWELGKELRLEHDYGDLLEGKKKTEEKEPIQA